MPKLSFKKKRELININSYTNSTSNEAKFPITRKFVRNSKTILY